MAKFQRLGFSLHVVAERYIM